DIQSDNELFNDLVDETTEIMKAEILQSIMNRYDEKRFPIASRHELLTKDVKKQQILNKNIKTNDEDTKSHVRFDQQHYVIKSKYEKLVKNELDMEEVTSVGDVVADKFSLKSDEAKKEIVKKIQSLDEVDPQIYKIIESNNFIMSNAPPIINQVHLKENYSSLVKEANFKRFIGSSFVAQTDGTLILEPALAKNV